MRQPATDIGSMLIEELAPMIVSGSADARERLVTPSLIVRDSTGPAGG